MAQMLVDAPIKYAIGAGIDIPEYASLAKKLARIRKEIAPEIDSLLDHGETNEELRNILKSAIPRDGGHRGPFVYILSRAKGADPDLEIAAASELFYWADAGLDDVADGNTQRQGAESARVKHGDTFALYASNVLYGVAMAKVVDKLKASPDKLKKLAGYFSDRLHITSRGQAIDMLMSQREIDDVSMEEYISLIEETTGVDVGTNMKIGAVLAGLDDETVENLYQFGFRMGTMAQARDDVLDYCDVKDGEGNYIIGKQPFCDIESKKKRLPVLLTKDYKLKELPDWVYDEIEKTVLSPRRKEAGKFLDAANINSETKELLREILNYWSDIRIFQKIGKVR